MAFEEVVHQGAMLDKAAQAIILLHGRGGSARGMLDLAPFFGTDKTYIVAPQAKDGSWYPHSFMADESSNEPYLSSSLNAVQKLIEQIAITIPKHHLYLMGFSQGACLALEVTARNACRYGGVIAFTGALIGEPNPNKYLGGFEETPIFMSNGDLDPHIPLQRSQLTKRLLDQQGAKVTLQVYKGRAHTILQEEIVYVKNHFF